MCQLGIDGNYCMTAGFVNDASQQTNYVPEPRFLGARLGPHHLRVLLTRVGR